MQTPLKNQAARRLRQYGLRGWAGAILWAALHGAVQAQTSSLPNAHVSYNRPEVAALSGVVPTDLTRLRVWGFEVYDARLWTAVGFRYSQYAQFPFALELQYLRRLEGAAIASRSVDEMRRVGQLSEAQAQNWQTSMRQLFPDVNVGDRITGVNLPGVGAEFWVNGRRAGVIQDLTFARLFFGIWLDVRTSEPQMRAQLLRGLQP